MKGTAITVASCALLVAWGALSPETFNFGFDAIDWVFGWMGGFWVTFLVSASVGVCFLLAFPHVSAQAAIASVKDRIKHNLLSIRIFQDDLPTVAKGVAGSLGWNTVYLGLNLLPMVFLAGPFMYVWFQLDALYAFDPLQPGDKRMVVAELQEGVDSAAVEVSIPDFAVLGKRANLPGRVVLEVTASGPGLGEIEFRSGGETVGKVLAVGERPRRLARIRTSDPWGEFFKARDPMIGFGEPVLHSASFVRSIWLEYPAAPLGPFGGGEIAIMLLFMVVSLLVGFGLKGVFGVEI